MISAIINAKFIQKTPKKSTNYNEKPKITEQLFFKEEFIIFTGKDFSNIQRYNFTNPNIRCKRYPLVAALQTRSDICYIP